MQKNRQQYLVEKMKEQEEVNRTMPVAGQRVVIPLRDRTLDAMFYAAPVSGAPLLISVHGGGFMLGGCALDDGIHQAMCARNAVNILALDYRKGPEHPFPQALEDVYEGTQWILEHADQFHFDPKKTIMAGIGAGALLALSNMILAKRRRDLKIRGIIAFEPLMLIHCYDPEAPTYGGLKEHIHLPESKDISDLNEEIIGAEWVKAAGINEEMLRDTLFMPLLAKPEDIDPAIKIALIFSDQSHYMKWMQPMIRTIQDSGAYVEWISSPAKSGKDIDWNVLSPLIFRLLESSNKNP